MAINQTEFEAALIAQRKKAGTLDGQVPKTAPRPYATYPGVQPTDPNALPSVTGAQGNGVAAGGRGTGQPFGDGKPYTPPQDPKAPPLQTGLPVGTYPIGTNTDPASPFEKTAGPDPGENPDNPSDHPNPTSPEQPATPVDPNQARKDAIRAAYKAYLKRDASDAEVEGWLGNDNFDAEIKNSPEARGAAGGGYNKAALKAALLAQGGRASAAALAAFIAAHPEFAKGVTIGGSKKNKLYGPNGEYLGDMIRGTDSNNPTWDWDEGTGGDAGDGGGGGADPARSAFWNAIMKKALADPTADPKDPMIRNQVEAYRAEQERGARRFQEQQAEAGGAYYNPTNESRMANEKVGQLAGGFQATLLQKKWDSEKAEILEYAKMYGAYLTEQERNALQEKLAALDRALGWARLQQDAYQWDQDDEFRRLPK